MSKSEQSHLPPLVSTGVFSVSCSVDINAPRQKVWDVLLDFPKYGEWNPFVRVQTLVDPITKAPLPPPSASQPKVGQHLLMTVHIPPTMSETSKYQKTEEIITHVDHEEFRVAWKYATLPKWLLGAERWQCLSSLPSPDGGKETTKYETREVFSGPLAYIVKWFMRKGLEEAFAVMGDALKVRSETQAQEQGS